MKIGVLTDTHDQVERIEQAVEVLNKQGVELVVHCGDWVAPFTLRFYKDLKCPLKGVFGNNDGDRFRHAQMSKGLDISYEERFLVLEEDGRKIAVFHGDYREITDALIQSGKYDAVFHGHNHKAENKMIGKTLSLNAGTLMGKSGGAIDGPSLAIYDTATNTAELITL